MKKKIGLISIPIILLLVLSGVLIGYSTNNKTDPAVEKILNDTRESDFQILEDETLYDMSSFGKGIVSSPTGILVNNKKVYVADSKKNAIFVFNYDGELLEQIGATGNGDNQFLSPHQIRYYNEKYYVLDSGNNRVQVYDNNFLLDRSIELNKFEEPHGGKVADFSYSDISIDNNENIYVSSLAMSSSNAFIYKIDKNGTLYQIGNDFVGYSNVVDNNLYFVNHRTLLTEHKDGKTRNHYIAYENYLYKLSDDKLIEMNKLPFKYTPVGFTSSKDNMLMYSDRFDTLDKFDKNGDYVSTLYQFDEDTGIRYISYAPDINCIFASSPEKGKIYCIKESS